MQHNAAVSFSQVGDRTVITLAARGKTARESFKTPPLDVMHEQFEDMAGLAVECLIGRLDIIIGS
jgi:hypothetical protein